MLRTRTTAALTATLLTSIALVVPAAAQSDPEEELLPLSVTPTTGEALDWLDVSGGGCVSDAGEPGQDILVSFYRVPVEPSIVEWGLLTEPRRAEISEAGDWSVRAQLPPKEHGSQWVLDADDVWFVKAACYIGTQKLGYEPVPFDLVEPPAATTTTTAPPAATPPAATPVVEEPPFTG
jgi:hypothetical protein